ncbi:MAG TPA: serine--tRNA ligase [Nitratifractor sp.]|nr:serine--tRNA ligase [Nitratifractor sp.]HHH20771.1 serine--tRNA ligase [Nitratifractor sp.]
MLDLKLIERDFESAKSKLAKKGVNEALLNELKERFAALKDAKRAFEEKRAQQKSLSKEFGAYKAQGKDISELKEQLDALKSEISTLESSVQEIESGLQELAFAIPNFPDDSVPEGLSEDDNLELKKVLEPKEFSFTPKEHWELAELNGWIDFERGVKLAKSRFALLKSDAAKLERALINFFLDFNAKSGFAEVCPPVLNNSSMLLGTGQLPKFGDDLFKIEGEDLYLIPTAEVPLTNIYNNEILQESELPQLLTAYTPCFRKEAGSAGRDTRGIIRQHQFDKVEMVAIAHPDRSDKIFEMMVQNASDILSALGLPHRLVDLCGGDLGFSAARTIDLEVWLPGQNKYREISSVSNMRDFQARRAKIRFKDGKKNSLVHTLNGSALAVGRTLIAIMENYQNEDGTIDIPEVLKPYMNRNI